MRANTDGYMSMGWISSSNIFFRDGNGELVKRGIYHREFVIRLELYAWWACDHLFLVTLVRLNASVLLPTPSPHCPRSLKSDQASHSNQTISSNRNLAGDKIATDTWTVYFSRSSITSYLHHLNSPYSSCSVHTLTATSGRFGEWIQYVKNLRCHFPILLVFVIPKLSRALPWANNDTDRKKIKCWFPRKEKNADDKLY
jgi:hypothetical protein